MNVIIIASNVGSINDGVGGYARYLSAAMQENPNVNEVIIKSGETDSFNKIKMITSNEMCRAIRQATLSIKRKKIDLVIVEYPFKEYNPLIIPLLRSLKKQLHKNGGKLALSLHEYFRAKKVRQIVMRKLAKISDLMFVTENKIKEYFEKLDMEVYIRDIPSIIPVNWDIEEKKEYQEKNFVYFGLVIANKAFDEMIEAWKVFNKNKEYRLDIMTSTNIQLDNCDKYNIKVLMNLCDEDIAEHMKDATFCILPIKPQVGMYNTTFKTATRAGCTIIGSFEEQFKSEKFAVHIENYELSTFVNGLERASRLTNEELDRNAQSAIYFGQRFSFEYTATQIINEVVKER